MAKSIYFEYEGRQLSLEEWAEELDQTELTLLLRWRKYGTFVLPTSKAKLMLVRTRATNNPKRYKVGRRDLTLKQWSEELDIGYPTLFARAKAGLTGRALIAPLAPNATHRRIIPTWVVRVEGLVWKRPGKTKPKSKVVRGVSAKTKTAAMQRVRMDLVKQFGPLKRIRMKVEDE